MQHDGQPVDEATYRQLQEEPLNPPRQIEAAPPEEQIPVVIINEISSPNVIKRSLQQAVEITLASILESVNGIATGFILARVSDDALSASSLISVTQAVLIIPMMASLNSIAIKIRQIPSNDPQGEILIGKLWRRGLILGTGLGIPISLTLAFGAAPLLSLMGQRKELTSICQSFFSAYAWGVVPRAWLRCTQQLAFGINQQRIVIAIRTLNILLLAYPVYALTIDSNKSVHRRVAGLGYAFSLQVTFGALIFLGILLLMPRFRKYRLFQDLLSNSPISIRDLWALGWPIALLASTEFVGSYVSTILIGLIGKDELSAQQISLGFAFLIIEFTFGTAQSASYLSGEYAGNKNYSALKKAGYVNYLSSLFLPAAAFIIFLFATDHMAYLYIDTSDPKNKHILKILEILMPLKAIALACDAIKNVSYGLLSGLSDTLTPSLYSGIGTLLVGISCSAIFGIAFNGDIYGIILGQAVGMLVNATLLGRRWKRISNDEALIQATMANPQRLSAACCSTFCQRVLGNRNENQALLDPIAEEPQQAPMQLENQEPSRWAQIWNRTPFARRSDGHEGAQNGSSCTIL